MNDHRPRLWSRLRSELAAGRHWADRAVVLGHAVLTGAIVVAFTQLAEVASAGFEWARTATPLGPWFALIWTPAITVAVLWWTRRFVPGAAGSGIPAVIAALDDRLPLERRARFVSLRLSVHKIGLVAGSLLAGLSVGREGPTVQVGAGVMLNAQRWLSPRAGIDAHDLMVAGAAAGIAAAFNTPLGGLIFALEQLSRRRQASHSATVLISIVLAGLVAVSVFGNVSHFGQLRVQQIGLELLGPGLAVALIAGLAGGLMSRLVVESARGMPDRFSHWRRQHPLRFGAGCALAVAAIGWASNGTTAGAGYEPTKQLLEGGGGEPGVFTVLKFCATWLSLWSGVPGGLFAPSLAIGASIGHDVAWIAGVAGEAAIPLIALGMVGFLAASTQGPITAFIIVMEMVAGHAMVLSLMASALLASGVARWIAGSLYVELADQLIAGVLPATPADVPEVDRRRAPP